MIVIFLSNVREVNTSKRAVGFLDKKIPHAANCFHLVLLLLVFLIASTILLLYFLLQLEL